MKQKLSKILWLSVVLAMLMVMSISSLAQAHGKTTVGNYDIEIGFHNEPAYVGEPNSLDLFITNTKTGKGVND